MTSSEMAEHNEMVAGLNEDYAARQNERVPIVVAWDEALWLDLAGPAGFSRIPGPLLARIWPASGRAEVGGTAEGRSRPYLGAKASTRFCRRSTSMAKPDSA